MFEKIVKKIKDKKVEADKINSQAEENVKKRMPQGAGSTSNYVSEVAKEMQKIKKGRENTKIFETKAPMAKMPKSMPLNTVKKMPIKSKGQQRLQDLVRGVSYKKNY